MNAEHDEQEQVRRLLAAAAGPDPEQMPQNVAGRLDDVLAGLVSERADAPVTTTEEGVAEGSVPEDEVTGVTQLASRRRRRWPQLLLAAAAVSVIALGVGIDDLTSGQGDSSTSAEAPSVATQDDAAGGAGAAPERLGARSPEDAETNRDLSTPLPEAASDFPRLRTASLRADVQRVADFSLTAAMSDGLRRSGGCVLPETGAGDEWLPVRLDGESAVLVLRAPAGGRRTAEVFTCDDADTPAVSTTIEAR